jgi:hypothetical protein
MLPVCRAFVRIDSPPLSDADLLRIGEQVFADTEDAANQLTSVGQAAVKAELTEGSLGVAGTILASGAVVVGAIVAWDSFWSGVERIHGQAKSVGHFLRNKLRKDLAHNGKVLSTRVSTGQLGKLHRLHRDVSNGTRDPESAVREVLRTFKAAGESLDRNIIVTLERAFHAAPRGMERLAEAETIQSLPSANISRTLEAPKVKGPVKRLTIERLPGSREKTVQLDHRE